jgi:hypothetical protein
MNALIRTSLLSLLLIATIGLIAGCSSDESADVPAGSSPDTEEVAPIGGQTAAKLDVRVERVGSKAGTGIPVPSRMRCTMSIPASCGAQIECPVAEDSTDEDAMAVCVWVGNEGRAILTEEPAEREICTQQYGGPETATVKGTIDGDDVDATFSRENGCEISRFEAVMPLWTAEFDSESAADASEATPSSEPEAIDDPPSAFDS